MCAFLLGTCAYAHAQAPGSTCATAIQMGSDYTAQVQSGTSVWYSAWTFDLPLTVTFAPAAGQSGQAPVVEMDFSCTTGIYEDSILCSLFCASTGSSGLSFDLPHKPQLKSRTLDDGTFVYYIAIGKSYRDLLLQVGIDYNVEVYVKVTYKSDGTISLAPDNLFSNCVDGAKFMHFGDTVQVAASDTVRHVIVPYVQWQEDTIRYVWNGTTPCTVVVGNTCDFNPSRSDIADEDLVLQHFVLAPGESKTVTADLLSDYVHNPAYPNEAGMYFAKFYSSAPGTIQVVKAPRALPRKNATLLRHGHTYPLNANDTSVFAIPRSWNDDTLHTYFSTPTEHVFRMTIATDPDFSDAHTLKTYQFEQANTGHWLGIYGTEIKTFWRNTTEQYLYVRFDCSEATPITIEKWKPSSCVNTAVLINSKDTTFRALRSSSSPSKYKFNYEQLRGGDWSFTFTPAATYKVFVGKDCNLTNSTTASNLLTYRQTSSTQNKATIKAEKIEEWVSDIDEEGYVYIYIYHTNYGICNVRIISAAPEEKDPVYPAVTVSVACDEGGNKYVRVSENQHIVISQGTTEKRSFDAVAGETYTLSDLPSGTYVLRGKNDEIEIKL